MSSKKGNSFAAEDDRRDGSAHCATIIAQALQSELGGSHRAAKTLMRWTGACERTVKHWLTGQHGPSGDYLIDLLRNSDAVFEALMIAADRRDAVIAARVPAMQAAIEHLVARMGRREPPAGPAGGHAPHRGAGSRTRGSCQAADGRETDRKGDRESDAVLRLRRELNPRQRWYLEALDSGFNVRAVDLAHHWGVSEKTARRDLAALKMRGLVIFEGSCRTGRYHVRS